VCTEREGEVREGDSEKIIGIARVKEEGFAEIP